MKLNYKLIGVIIITFLSSTFSYSDNDKKINNYLTIKNNQTFFEKLSNNDFKTAQKYENHYWLALNIMFSAKESQLEIKNPNIKGYLITKNYNNIVKQSWLKPQTKSIVKKGNYTLWVYSKQKFDSINVSIETLKVHKRSKNYKPNKKNEPIVHEWGSLTILQGQDGAIIGDLPQSRQDLPDWVYLLSN